MVGKKNHGSWKNRFLMFCVLSQNQLSSEKLFLFTLQLAVVHTALYVHDEFCFELGLNKVILIKSVHIVQGTILGHSKTPNVAYCFKTHITFDNIKS